MAKSIWAVAEQRDGKYRKISFEVVSEARRIADKTGADVIAVVLGAGIEGIASELGKYGADTVLVADDSALEVYTTDAYVSVLSAAIKEKNPDMVLVGASVQGKDLSARLAAAVDAGLAMDCTEIKVDGDEVIAVRPIFAGKIFSDIGFSNGIKMISIRPNVFAPEENEKAGSVEKITVSIDADALKTKVVDVQADTSGKVDLTEAEIIVSGGRGMKGPENFSIIEELADLLGATVGASRAAVDAGWRPEDDQVGQTGKVVTPNLYIACGISGAIQHLAGMGSSKNIVAVNKDEDAPIFQKADYGVVEDLFNFVPAFTEVVKKNI